MPGFLHDPDRGRFVLGCVVWLGVAVIIAVPELIAAFGTDPPWRTISTTVGYLQHRWPIVGLVVVAVIVGSAALAIRTPFVPKGVPRTDVVPDSKDWAGRSPGGRVEVRVKNMEATPLGWGSAVYFVVALLIVFGTTYYVSTLPSSDDTYRREYALYGLIGLFFLVLPMVASALFGKEVPFMSLYGTFARLQKAWPPLGVILLVGLVILLLHLALYPWPDVADPPDPDAA